MNNPASNALSRCQTRLKFYIIFNRFFPFVITLGNINYQLLENT